jgi:hypothetical protein
MENDWKSFIMPFGKKHKGETMYMIYINDFDYIRWLDSITLSPDIRSVVDAAIEHKNKTDPWSS